PKWPMPKIVVHTIALDAMNAAAPANTGRERAASHNKIGSSQAMGSMVSQVSCPRERMAAVMTASAASAATLWVSSPPGGGCTSAAPRPITGGATGTTPTTSDANQ